MPAKKAAKKPAEKIARPACGGCDMIPAPYGRQLYPYKDTMVCKVSCERIFDARQLAKKKHEEEEAAKKAAAEARGDSGSMMLSQAATA